MSQQDCTLCTCISRSFYFGEMLEIFPPLLMTPSLQSWATLFLTAMGNKDWIILLASEGNLLISGQLSLRDGLCSICWIMQLSWFWHNCSIIPATVNTKLQETLGRQRQRNHFLRGNHFYPLSFLKTGFPPENIHQE